MNDKNNITYDISKDIRTIKEAEEFCSEASFVLNNIYNVGNNNVNQILSKHSSEKTAGIIKRILADNKVLPSDFASCEKILNEMIEQIKKMKIVRLTLAIQPSDDLLDRISQWVNENLGKNNLIEIDKDEQILGGAILSIDGKYKDFSLKKSLSDIFQTKKAELVSIISPK